MPVETWLKESDNGTFREFCKIGKDTFCCNCINGEHQECISSKDYENDSFSCACDCGEES